MSDISEFIKRIAKRTGFKREFFAEKNMPTDPSDIVVIPFFGDLRSTFILSSLLLRSYKEANVDKYVVLCTWPGLQSLFPYVDEYWTIDDEMTLNSIAAGANNLYNSSNTAFEITRSLLEALDVLTAADLKALYDNGFTAEYWKTFGEVKRFLPDVPSANLISHDFKLQMSGRVGRKIILHPATKMRSWQRGKASQLAVSKEFWSALIERLIADGYDPVLYQNQFSYDMSQDFLDRCLYLVPKDMSDVLAAFRHIGCVLDVHTGVSRIAIAARCPFLAVTERQIFIGEKDYEVDDLCADDLPRQYVYSFSTQLMVGGPEEWEVSVVGNIMNRLKQFLPSIDQTTLPSTTGSYTTVSYTGVRERKAKRIGMAFIKTSKKK